MKSERQRERQGLGRSSELAFSGNTGPTDSPLPSPQLGIVCSLLAHSRYPDPPPFSSPLSVLSLKVPAGYGV